MLKTLYCDKFNSNGEIRTPIVFNPGLNTVLGSNTGSNSIGKSTFLMIVDFAFGGTDYIDKSKDVIKNVGNHTIFFSFEFDGKTYYFSRCTATPKTVSVCDEDNNVIESKTIKEYKEFLKEKYDMGNLQLSFRAAVGKFFRVYLKECCDEGNPLKSATRVSDKNGIIEFLKLYNKYSVVDELISSLKEAEEQHNAFKKSIEYSQINASKNKTEYKKNLKEIEKYQEATNNILLKSSEEIFGINSDDAKTLAETKGKISVLKRKLCDLILKKNNLEYMMHSSPVEENFEKLLEFFPNAETQSIYELENFHSEISEILKDECTQKINDINLLMKTINQQIKDLEDEVRKIADVEGVSKRILEEYSVIKRKHDELVEANKNFDEIQNQKNDIKSLKDEINENISNELSKLEQLINKNMSLLNDKLYDEKKYAPVIKFKDVDHYSFETPNDYGTGSRYKGLILFDISVLKTSQLPSIAHDSFMLKNIEDQVLEKILELYISTEKQIFIALDKQNSYTAKVEKILSDSTVLKLSSNGNELFGRSWNII